MVEGIIINQQEIDKKSEDVEIKVEPEGPKVFNIEGNNILASIHYL